MICLNERVQETHQFQGKDRHKATLRTLILEGLDVIENPLPHMSHILKETGMWPKYLV